MRLHRCLVALFALFLVACVSSVPKQAARGGDERAVALTEALGLPDSTTDDGAYSDVSDYRIGPLDLLEITVFQVQDLNRTVRVNSAGQISLPLIGSLQAGGRTAQELEARIAGMLAERYLQDPQVSVFVKEFTSQRVTVEGAVKKPGIYPLRGRTTLLQTIAMAEGLDPLANLQGVVIFRTVESRKMAAVFDMRAIRSGEAEDPMVYGDDIVVVDQSDSKTALRRFIESVPVLSLFVLL